MNKKFKAQISLLFVTTIWGLTFVMVKKALNDAPPFSFASLRFGLATILALLSVNKKFVFKTLNSSGTSGREVSKIYLDKENASRQTKILTKIISNFLGNKRLPMLIIDSKSVIKDRNIFSARSAGIIGFSMLGKDITFALDDNMELDI